MVKRVTGTYRETTIGGEKVRAFIPQALPPSKPKLIFDEELLRQHTRALEAMARLEVAGSMVPSRNWFLYGFVRREALTSSQIEGTQATFKEVVTFESTRKSGRPADVEEVCNYVDAFQYARKQMHDPKGLPLGMRLLCEAHMRLLKGVRGANKQPGAIRSSQNWIGGSRPGTARFVPPPPDVLPELFSDFDRWLNADDGIPPLIRVGLAHVQFETLHPFLDGNGRIGRLLIGLLIEHWKLMSEPLLYTSLTFKRRRQEYYDRLSKVRTEGDWEGWTGFFLDCVSESADNGVDLARRIFALIEKDRRAVLEHKATTVPAARLFEQLPVHPMVTMNQVIELLNTTRPTADKAVNALVQAGILYEVSGKRRDRFFAYRAYLDNLGEDTDS